LGPERGADVEEEEEEKEDEEEGANIHPSQSALGTI
jgi:hypothetical protein